MPSVLSLLLACADLTDPPPAPVVVAPAPPAPADEVGRDAFDAGDGPGRGPRGDGGGRGPGMGRGEGRGGRHPGMGDARGGGPPEDAVDGGPRGPGGGAGGGGGGAGMGAMGGSPVSFVFNGGKAMVHTGDGVRHLVYTDQRRAVYKRGTDTMVEAKSPITGNVGAIAIEGDGASAIVLAWVSGQPGGMMGSVSTDAGATWSTPVPLSTPGQNAAGPTVRVWNTGGQVRAVVAWHEGMRDAPSTIQTATWDGKAWTGPTRVDTGTAQAAFPSLAGHGDHTVIVWRDNRAGTRQIWGAERDGVAGGFTGERWLGLTGMDPSVCVTPAGTVHVAFQTMQALNYARSEDGRTFGPPTTLDPSGLFGHMMCDAKDRVAVVWEDLGSPGGMKDDSTKRVGVAVSSDGGRTFRPLDVAGGAVQQVLPTGCLAGDGLDVAWVDKTTFTVKWTRWTGFP